MTYLSFLLLVVEPKQELLLVQPVVIFGLRAEPIVVLTRDSVAIVVRVRMSDT